ncbi:DUF1883 domain-containing protein [Kineococcus glutinatus]|uniref:TIR domain-containing protein n=1 Tax=Kineococcus glutinatus TaxID=1070872 RepID=A0ABP9HE98_9ACTN
MITNFTSYDLKQLKRGSVVVVTLQGNAANVRLLDSAAFSAFKAGRSYRMADGGLVKTSPHRMIIPRAGHWYVTVDLMGMKPNARVRSAVSVEPPPLPVARSARTAPLSEVRAERPPAQVVATGEVWDVFISHASEDKADIARPLRDALDALGVKVWFDAFEMGIGDSLRRKIDQGLARSAFGVVILSTSFFAKGWTQYELDGIVTRSIAGEQNLLPIWHKITRDEVMAQSPSLADKVARSTTDRTVAQIAEEIARRVRPDLFEDEDELVG